MPDGMLLHLRDTYPIETAWAPQVRRRRAPPGPRRRLGRPPGRPARQRRGPRRRSSAASTTDAAQQHDWPPATRPCTTPTGSARPCSPPSWPTGPTGTPPPAPQRHLAVAADAELRRRHPGQHYPPLRSAEPAARHRRPARRAHPDRGTAARRDGPVDQGPGRRPPHVRRHARRPAEPDGSRPRTPTTGTSARRSRPGPDRPRTRSCSRPSPRSARPRRSSSAPPTATPTRRPQIDGARAHPGAREVTAMTAIAITGPGRTACCG